MLDFSHSHCAQVERGQPSDLRLLVDVRAAHDEQLDHLEAVVPAVVLGQFLCLKVCHSINLAAIIYRDRLKNGP